MAKQSGYPTEITEAEERLSYVLDTLESPTGYYSLFNPASGKAVRSAARIHAIVYIMTPVDRIVKVRTPTGTVAYSHRRLQINPTDPDGISVWRSLQSLFDDPEEAIFSTANHIKAHPCVCIKWPDRTNGCNTMAVMHRLITRDQPMGCKLSDMNSWADLQEEVAAIEHIKEKGIVAYSKCRHCWDGESVRLTRMS